MEAVFANAVVFVTFHRQGVEVGGVGHGLVESGIEDHNIGHSGEVCFAGADTLQVGGIVQGGKRGDGVDTALDLLGHDDRLGEAFAAVDDAVANGVDFGDRGQNADFGIDEASDSGLGVVVGGDLFRDFGIAGALVTDAGLGRADSLDDAFCEHLLVCNIEEHVLERGTTGVDDENLGDGFVHGMQGIGVVGISGQRVACADESSATV